MKMQMRKKAISLLTALALLASMFAGIMPAAGVNAADITSGLLLHYSFDSDSLKTVSSVVYAIDESGNENNGVVYNGAIVSETDDRAGIGLDGTNQYVSMPAGVLESQDNFTIATWMYLVDDSNGAWARIYDFGNSDTDTTNLLMTKNLANVLVWTNGGASYSDWTFTENTSEVPASGEWVHMAFTREGQTLKLYKNGTLIDTDTLSESDSSIFTEKMSAENSPTCYIGRSNNAADPYLKAEISDFRIYGDTLGTAQIMELAGVEDTITSIDSESAATSVNTAPVLPETVTANYLSGETAELSVTWDSTAIASAITAIGSYEITGDVTDSDIDAVLYLTVGGDPYIWYKFEEESGTTLENSGTGGSDYNATTAVDISSKAGKDGNALSFDGDDQFAEIGKELTFGNNITVSSWVYVTESDAAMLFCFGSNDTDNDNKFWMNQKSVQNSKYTAGMEPGWGTTDGEYNNIVSDSIALPTKQWVHIAVTFEGTTAKLYRAGELIATKTLLNQPSDYNGKYVSNLIGKSAWYSLGDPLFTGYMDDFRIYNRTLSDTEISDLVGVSHENSNIESINEVSVYTSAGIAPILPSTVTAVFSDDFTKSVDVSWAEITSDQYATEGQVFTVTGTVTDSPINAIATVTVSEIADPDMILWYKMDDESGTVVSDMSGNGNNGTIIGGEGWTTGKDGGAANLTGSNYISLPDGIMEDVEDFTISTWECQSDVINWQRLFDFGTGTSYYMYFTLCDSSSNLRFSMNVNNSWQEITSSTIDDEGVWHHIAISKSGSTATVYVDGVAVGTSTSMTYTPADIGTTTQTYIGKSQYSADSNYEGQVDDFRIYKRALSEEEIQTVISEVLTDEEAVEMNRASLDLEDTFNVQSNITLKTQGTAGVSINWESSDENYVTSEGVITRPTEDEGLVKVTLTATLMKNEVSETKDFTITLLPEGAAPYVININADGKGVDINPTLNGIFFEDINYSLDGGLYPELVQNKSFEYFKVTGSTTRTASTTTVEEDLLYSWNLLTTGDGTGSITTAETDYIHENNTNYLELTVASEGDGVGIYNTGFSNTTGDDPEPSMEIVQNDKYNFSFWVKSDDFTGPIEVALTNSDGTETYDSLEFDNITSEWQKLEGVIEPNSSDDSARLQILAKGTGTIDIDMVSLFPQRTWLGRENGVRYDLGKMLSDMKPKYFRFPGGCAVEGVDMDNAYNWKLSVGPLEERKNNYNFWFQTSSPYTPHYNQSLGMGFYEFFQFSEDIGATPVPCINVGMSFTSSSLVSTDDLNSYIQDAIDLIEFANGDPETNEWAALRKEMGHAEPFDLKYLEIGNENTGTNYYTRYQIFAEAIRDYLKDKDYDIKLIVGGGITIGDDFYLTTWENLQNEEIDADTVDEHYYVPNATFYSNMNRYDNYDRDAQTVFIGEFASNSRSNNITDALAEASYMTHIEENGDIIELASYAPLLAKQNFTQWTPDLIYFNNQAAYGSVNYYVQKLFTRNTGDYTLPTELVQYGSESHKIQGGIGLATYGTAVTYKDVKVTDNDTADVLLSGDDTADSQWTVSEGTWNISDGTFAQTDENASNTLVYAGDITSSNYTIELKARKDSGDEGFLIHLGMEDEDNYLRWNIGGFSNTKSGFERCVDGTTTQLVPYYDNAKFPSVNEDIWYDLKIVVVDNTVKCYIKAEDDEDYIEAFDIVDRPKTGPVYTISSKDEETGDIIVKIVNPQSTSQDLTLNISDADYINSTGVKTVLAGNSSSDANSFSNPKNVIPVTTKITGLSNETSITVDAYSLTILRISTSEEDKPELSDVEISANVDSAEEDDTFRINIESAIMSDESEADLGNAAISYECDQPELVAFEDDGRATILSGVGDVDEITFWVNVYLNGTTVKSNEVSISLTKTEIASVGEIFVSTVANIQPEMPEKIYVEDVNGVTKLENVTWDEISDEELYAGNSFTVNGDVEGTDLVATANVTVSDAVIMTGMSSVISATSVDTQPVLPSTIVANYNDNTTKNIDISWDSIDSSSLASAGTIEVNGTYSIGTYENPLIEQRADPYIYRHADGYYYFTASYPDYDRIVIRKAATIQGLADAEETIIWEAHETGEMANHIWAPELHFINGRWYMYFAAGTSTNSWAIRPYVLECTAADPTVAENWEEKGMLQAAEGDNESFTNFSLDSTTFEHNGEIYIVWAQKTTYTHTPSNLYIAKMLNPWTLKTQAVLISTPDYDWEKQTYWVNEGSSVIKKNDRIFISFSASATDETYCMGLLTADDSADLLDASSWSKSEEPVMTTSEENEQFGPGHNTFTVAEDGVTDILVYHSRPYAGYLEGMDALSDPNRHTQVKVLTWNDDGTPNFGEPEAAGEYTALGTVAATVTVTESSNKDTNVPVAAITVSGGTAIETKNGTLQMTAAVLPNDATDSSVTWSVENGTGSATISTSGLLTAVSNGTITVMAAANDSSGVFGTAMVTISGQDETTVIPVTAIAVNGKNSKTKVTKGSTLQMIATVSPSDATDSSVTWSVENGTGSATISTSGLLKGVSTGTVIVTATANDASGITGTATITVIKSSSSSGGSSSKKDTTSTSSSTSKTVINMNTVVSSPILKSDGTAVAGVTSDDIKEALSKAKADENGVKTVVLEVKSAATANNYAVEIPNSVLSSGNEKQAYEIKTPVGTLAAVGNMFNNSELDAAGNVQISMGMSDKTGLNEKLKQTIGDRPVLELSASANGKTIEWNNSLSPVKVSIPYNPVSEELKDPEHIVVWYIDEQGNTVSVPTGRYDAETGMVTFKTTHFSKYAVAFVKKSFNDIEDYSWANKQIEVMASKGIINGTSQTTYSPERNITRADFVLLLIKSLGLNAEVDSNFDDVKTGTYYYEALGIARKLGIISGVGGNKFNPEQQISRQDMMVIVARAMSYAGKISNIGSASDISDYGDALQVADYAKTSVATLIKEGLIEGSDNMINPNGTATRAETAVIIYRIYNK